MKQVHLRTAWITISAGCFIGFFAANGNYAVQQTIWTLLALASALTIMYAVARGRIWARSAWSTVASATGIIVLINVARIVTDTPRQAQGVASTIFGTLLTAVFALLTVAAYLMVSRHRRIVSDSSGIVDAAIVFVAAAMVATQFLLYPFWTDPALTTSQRIGLLVFDGLNVLLLSFTVRLWFSTDRTVNRASRILAIGFLAMIISGGLGITESLPVQVLDPPLIANLILGSTMIFFAMSAAAALDATASRPPAADVDAGVAARSRVLALMALCVLVPPVLLLIAGDKVDSFAHSRPFVVLTILLTGLLIWRVNLLVQSYREAVHREHVLREINAGLMRAADLSEVNGRLSEWASRLVEQTEVTCVLGTAEELASVGLGPFGGRLRFPFPAVNPPVASSSTRRKSCRRPLKHPWRFLGRAWVWHLNVWRFPVAWSNGRPPNACNCSFTTPVTLLRWWTVRERSDTSPKRFVTLPINRRPTSWLVHGRSCFKTQPWPRGCWKGLELAVKPRATWRCREHVRQISPLTHPERPLTHRRPTSVSKSTSHGS